MRRMLLLSFVVLLVCVSGTGCVTWGHGIDPVQPHYGRSVSEAPLIVEWSPASEPSDETRYHVAIWDASGAQVYGATNLKETRYVVSKQLAPGKHTWSVRPLYLRDKKWVPGNWNHRKYFYFVGVLFGWGRQPYYFIYEPVAGGG